jgi:hypothetical protein
MSSIDRADPVILGHLLAQHRELHSLVSAVHDRFEQLAADPAASGQAATLRQPLQALRDYLDSHFHQEEQGGFIEESLARMPRLAAAAKAVLAEHPRLLGELDRLIASLPGADISRLQRADLESGFDRFCHDLITHERNENAVVQEGYNEDLGLMD